MRRKEEKDEPTKPKRGMSAEEFRRRGKVVRETGLQLLRVPVGTTGNGIAKRTMVEIAPGEFRTPNRHERRAKGIRPERKDKLAIGPLEPLPAMSDADRRRAARMERHAVPA
jgi:hypothetical protein